MEKIFHSTFDFFSYAVPGCGIVLAILFAMPEYVNLEDYINLAGKLQVGSGVVLLIAAYVLGFAINPVGRFIYMTIGFKIFKKRINKKNEIDISEKYAIIREFSPNNFKYIETWNMLCSMSHNLAIASFLTLTSCVWKLTLAPSDFKSVWFGGAIVFLILFFLLLQRAVTFAIWAANDINAAIKALHLKEQADKNATAQ